MTTRLTLTIDKKLVQRVKKYAQNNSTSVSKIVSDYLNTLNTGVMLTQPNDLSPRLKKLTGAFKVPCNFKLAYYHQMEKKQNARKK